MLDSRNFTVFYKNIFYLLDIFFFILEIPLFLVLDSRFFVWYALCMHILERKLLDIIKDNPDVSPADLVALVGVSRSAVHSGLRVLLQRGFVEKRGTPPHVYYRVIDGVSEIVQDSFLYKDASGGLLFGMEGFAAWSGDRFDALPLADKVRLYEKGFTAYQQEKEGGLFFEMDASLKIPSADIVFDSLRCFDLYTLHIGEEAKRTKEAVLLEVVKGSGSPAKMKDLVQEYVASSVEKINTVIEKDGIDGVAFVPPTAMRKVQIMRILESVFADRNCHGVDRVAIRRDFTGSDSFRQEQKHIANVANRVVNARNTYRVTRSGKVYEKLLLVDDLVGSGATVNEIARKFKEAGIAKEVHCLCLVGINSKKLVVVRKM